MNVQSIEIGKIIPYPKNAKKHPEKQINQIVASIKEFGFNQAIVVDKKLVVIAGHGRLAAAHQMKLKEVPVLIVDLPEDKAKAYRLADNKLNETDWDMELVIEELKSLDAELAVLTGFEMDLGELDLEEKETEVDVDSMGETSSITFKFSHDKYLEIIGKIEQIKEAQEFHSSEEVLENLLENYAL